MFHLLNGIKVLDLTTIVLGPYATQILGDFGADVIKVEAPAGDLFRTVRPGRSDAMGAAFLNCNRNKRSIVLDLSQKAGLKALKRMIKQVDVVVHNMRPKSAKKLGISYDDVRKIKEDIIYCNACGFGQGGQYENTPAYDDTLQAVSGLAALNADDTGAPRYLPTVLCDKVAGLHLAIAVLGGLVSKMTKGQGVSIEVPMYESMASFLLIEHMAGQTFDPALGDVGYSRMLTKNRKPFATKDGYVSILPYNGNHWKRFCEIIGDKELAEDPRVTSSALRSQNLDMLYGVIARVSLGKTTAEWLSVLKENDIPAAPVNKLEDLLQCQHLKDVGFFEKTDHPTEGRLQTARSAFAVEGADVAPDRLAPRLGADSHSILSDFGFSEGEISELA